MLVVFRVSGKDGIKQRKTIDNECTSKDEDEGTVYERKN